MKYETGVDGFFHYILEELSYDDFDKSGRMSMWKLSKMVEGARFARIKYGPDRKWRNNAETAVFLRSQSFKILPAFYALNMTQNTSLKLTSCMSHVGETSYCQDTEIQLLTTGELLASFSTHAVMILRATRRPTPVPALAREDIHMVPFQKRPVSGPEFPVRPSGSFTLQKTVMLSDTDYNEHLNQAAFIRFCFDCAGMAAMQGNLASFTDDVIYSDAEAVWVLYLSEAKMGQELTLSCWEDRERNRTLWVEVRLGSGVVGQCQLKFYEDGPKHTASKSEQAQTIAKL